MENLLAFILILIALTLQAGAMIVGYSSIWPKKALTLKELLTKNITSYISTGNVYNNAIASKYGKPLAFATLGDDLVGVLKKNSCRITDTTGFTTSRCFYCGGIGKQYQRNGFASCDKCNGEGFTREEAAIDNRAKALYNDISKVPNDDSIKTELRERVATIGKDTALYGGEKLPVKKCKSCNGTGNYKSMYSGKETCFMCYGNGFVPDTRPAFRKEDTAEKIRYWNNHNPATAPRVEVCRICEGAKTFLGSSNCYNCDGAGFVTANARPL